MTDREDFEEAIDDEAFMKTQDFEDIADELFEVDRTGIMLQGLMSFMVASVASIGSYLITGIDPFAVIMVFMITFLPNFGLKVLAEYIKKRSLVKGLQRGYTAGRKDGLLEDTRVTDFYKWLRVYLALDSATFTGGRG